MKKILKLLFSNTAKDTSVLFVGNSVNSLLAVLFTILVARILGPESFGVLSALISFIAIMAVLADLGIGASLFRFAANNYENILFSLRLITSVAIFLIILSLSKPLSLIIFDAEKSLYVIISALGVFSFLLFDFQLQLFQSRKKFFKSSVFLISSNLARLLIILILFSFGKTSIVSILIVYAATPLIISILSLKTSGVKIILHMDKKIVTQEIYTFSRWAGLGRILGSVSGRIDTLLLIKLVGAYETGIYSAGRQIVQGVPIFVGSFATVLAPRFATLKGENLISYFKKSIVLSLILSMTVLFGVFLAPFVILLFGDKYQSSVRILQILLISFIPFTIASPAVNMIIYAMHKPKIITYLSVIQLFFIYFGNIYLIPKFGIYSPPMLIAMTDIITLITTYPIVFLYLKNHEN